MSSISKAYLRQVSVFPIVFLSLSAYTHLLVPRTCFLLREPEIINEFLFNQTPESLQNLELHINSELFLDTLLMEIRGATIKYSSQKKRENKAQEELLIHDIEILENQQQNQSLDNDQIAELNSKKEALENIMKHEAEGAFVRSRIKYKLDGEKPSKLFCSLEKHHGTQRYVPQLVVKDEHGQEHLLKDQDKIEAEICSFYTDLFSNKDSYPERSIQSFLGNSYDSLPKLSENQKTKMEGNM